MNTQRVGLMAMRRAALRNPLYFAQQIPRLAFASSQARRVSTEKLSHSEADRLLAEQRSKRPVSPHLEIYDYRQTWLNGSIWQRITGVALSGILYVFGAAYLVAPLTGWHLETASLATAFAAWPTFAKGGFKFLIAWPFTQHAIAGVRHLVWDFILGVNRPSLAKTTDVLWPTSILTAAGLVAFL